MLELTVTEDIDIEDMTKELDPEVAAIAEDAWLLYKELATRIYERGVTLEELVAAAAANDVEAIDQMFGYTEQDFEAVYRRIVDLAERARAAGLIDYPPGALGPPARPK